MGKGNRQTPDELDYLFERDIIDEEDYVDFWVSYWRKRSDSGRNEVIREYLEIAQEGNQVEILAGVVTRDKKEANRQAKILGGKVVRRNARGRFSKRGTRYQAVRKSNKQ